MEIPKNFAFYGVQKPLPPGDYEGVIKSFSFKDMTARNTGKPYVALSMIVEIASETRYVNLSLNPNEKGKALNKLILQLVNQTGKTEKELIELCAVPQDFFNVALGKKVQLESTEKGYLDVWAYVSAEPPTTINASQVINPNDIPF